MAKKIRAEIVADSINGNGNRITTFLLTYPRFIHGEIMTHRLFSRNSASSRAIPFEKMVKMVEEDPFIPIAWQKDHKGMQGAEYITEPQEVEMAQAAWLFSKDDAVDQAIGLNRQGVTKQLCNRLLEPYMWHTTLITATEFENFFDLRLPSYGMIENGKSVRYKSKKDLIVKHPTAKTWGWIKWQSCNISQAEIHIQALAEAMWDAHNESNPQELKAGEWHMPFGDKIDFTPSIGYYSGNTSINGILVDNKELRDKIKVSTARCARLSYMTFDEKIDYEKDIKLHDQLLKSKHFSPFEHIAKCPKEYISSEVNIHIDKGYTHIDLEQNLWSGNFKGWIQYRQLIP